MAPLASWLAGCADRLGARSSVAFVFCDSAIGSGGGAPSGRRARAFAHPRAARAAVCARAAGPAQGRRARAQTHAARTHTRIWRARALTLLRTVNNRARTSRRSAARAHPLGRRARAWLAASKCTLHFSH